MPFEIDSNDEGCVGSIKVQNVKTKEIKDLKQTEFFHILVLRRMLKDFSGQIMQDERGFIKVDEQMRTSTMGVFAAGDVRITPLRQVITAVVRWCSCRYFSR